MARFDYAADLKKDIVCQYMTQNNKVPLGQRTDHESTAVEHVLIIGPIWQSPVLFVEDKGE